MTATPPLTLIDPDYRRRARITSAFAKEGRHIEPYEDATDLIPAILRSGIFLIYNTGDLLERVIKAARANGNRVSVIAYSDKQELRAMFLAIRAGAVGYIVLSNTDLELIESVQLAEIMLDNTNNFLFDRDPSRYNTPYLTARERQILKEVASGSSNRQIADIFGISHRTVEIHRSNVLRKLGASNSAEAVHIASSTGIIT